MSAPTAPVAAPSPSPSNAQITVGELAVRFLEQCGTRAAFGVISIHNMPILDAFNTRRSAPKAIRFVPARGEAGACNMADAYARVTGNLGVCVTSTGTGAGNAAGALVEAITAGTPMLHLTGQIEAEFLDRDLGFIHEAPAQMAMLQAVGKTAFRIRNGATALATLREAVRIAQTPPCGPVSVEIPIDIQASLVDVPQDLSQPMLAPIQAPASDIDTLAGCLQTAKRPLLWLGGGARMTRPAVERFIAMGWGVVTSVQGRGIIAEDHRASLGSYNLQKAAEDLYAQCDAMLVVGSRLRSNETLRYKLKLPKLLYRIDANALAQGRAYTSDFFVQGDALHTLQAVADRLSGKMAVATDWQDQVCAARQTAATQVDAALGPYATLKNELQTQVGKALWWVRDITLSNSMWGNRAPVLNHPRAGVHALGGGIGQGLAMAIGVAVANQVHGLGRKTVALAGDGGFILNVGELACAAQEKADILLLLMNDGGYGVIKNIQDDIYGSRHCYVDLHTPNFAQLCASMGVAHVALGAERDTQSALASALKTKGPVMLEVNMKTYGSFKAKFAGPILKKDRARTMRTSTAIDVTLIGFGAIGRALVTRLLGNAAIRVTHVVVRAARLQETQRALDELVASAKTTAITAVAQVPATAALALECAGHSALTTHVEGALQRGCECAVLSVGALSEPGLPEQLEAAAQQGRTQVHLLSGAIGGIEALGAARLAGLTAVTYTGRKPPGAWALQGVAAKELKQKELSVVAAHAQSAIILEAIILEASAREAARLYPKNANVAATVALAGLGLDATRVRLIADPNVTENVHEIHAQGAFGEMRLEMRGKPLADNPKTSALTVLSALRFLYNRANPVTI